MKKQHFNKFLSLAISICLLLTTVFTGLAISAETAASPDVWDGNSVSTELEGSGTADDPFLIQSGADLKYWSNLAAGGKGFSGNYFVLTKDIDLGERNFSFYTFGGTFDGNGYEIKGIKIVNNTLDNVGFFRNFSGTVKNLTLTGSVWGKSNVGGFAGYATAATLFNCVNNLSVKAEKTAGGLIGNIYPGSATTINISYCINNCEVNSTIAGTSSAATGGIVGYVGTNATVKFLYSQNNGSVKAGATDVAGFIGTNYGNLEFDHCANAGTVSANYAAGGFIGWNRVATTNTKTLKFANCINTGTIKATRTDGGNGWLDGILGVHSGSQNKSTVTQDKVYSINGCLDFGSSVDNQASATTFIGTRKNKSDFTESTIGNLIGHLYTFDSNGNPTLRQYSEGSGTKSNPYVLKTKSDLIMLSQMIGVEQLYDYPDSLFVLGNDIDLENDTKFVGIGNGYKSFKGDFDGQGYTVSNMNINYAHTGGIGFFGQIGSGASNVTKERKISNLTVEGKVISTATANTVTKVGGLVGKNTVKLTIENCNFNGRVFSNYNKNSSGSADNNQPAASGLVCSVEGALDIEHCTVSGEIDGYGRGGSFIGSLNGSFAVNINDSYSTATVTGMGSQTANAATSGGLIGFLATGTIRLNNCFFAGTAPAERSSGMGGPIINHHASGTFECNNVYYLADSASEYTTYNVGVNKTAQQFKDGTVVSLLNTDGIIFAQGKNHPIFMTKPYDVADLTADGIVDIADAVVVLRHIENVEELGEDAFSFADINGDGSIDNSDYVTVKYIALVGIVVDGPENTSWSILG